MKRDSVSLLVVLPGAELAKDVENDCCLVVGDSECVPSIPAAVTLFANNDGSDVIGSDAHADVG